MTFSLELAKPIVKSFLNHHVYALLNMDAYRKSRLLTLINTRFKSDRAAFAEAAGLSKGRVSQLLDPDDAFGERAAASLVNKLELPDRWFEMGASEVSTADPGSRRIPVISEIIAGNFRDIVDSFAMGGGEAYLETDLEVSPYTFALTLEGDSMMPEFNAGDRVIIDPDVQPHSGDYVAARDAKHRATFKKYRMRGTDAGGKEIFELIPLNDKYEAVRSDHELLEIIGTMVEHRRYRRRR